MKYIVCMLILLSPLLYSTEFQVDKAKKNLVKFVSDAKIETFDGTTDKIDGYIFYEGDDILSKNDIYLEVDLRTIDTGIGLRNRHMREDYLETDKYPMATFKGKITRANKISGNDYNVMVDGKMTIHGVTRPITVNGVLSSTGEGYRIKSNFELRLPDYNISVPSLMFMKISEVMKMELDFFTRLVKK